MSGNKADNKIVDSQTVCSLPLTDYENVYLDTNHEIFAQDVNWVLKMGVKDFRRIRK